MKKIIKNLITIAENIEDENTQEELFGEIKAILDEFAQTINCPSNWNNIGERLAEEYNTTEEKWIYNELDLWEYTE